MFSWVGYPFVLCEHPWTLFYEVYRWKHLISPVPCFQYLVFTDTNFINFSIQNKLDLTQAMMDCLYAKCIPCITDWLVFELCDG